MTIEQYFPSPVSQRWLCVGPLACEVDGYAARLASEGYADSSIRDRLRLFRRLSVWLEREGRSVETLDEQAIKAFAGTWGSRRRGRRAALVAGQGLLDQLRANGRVPVPVARPVEMCAIDRVALEYEQYLIQERGVGRTTSVQYVSIVHSFLADRFGTREVELGELVAMDANRFVLRHARHCGRSRAKMFVTALRSFLRSLYLREDHPADLSGAVLPVKDWQLSGLPKALAPEQVQATLENCDRSTAAGRRDHAILLFLARLGLRAGEMAELDLEDIDWNRGLVSVCGKGQRREPLPLPCEVGEALVEYLRNGRPQCSTRRVFIRLRAPHRGLGAGAISRVVCRALTRAGVENPPSRGAHLLRHSLATAMLGNDASLEEIGQILRHRHPKTTQIYAKVSIKALRALAPAWPEDAT